VTEAQDSVFFAATLDKFSAGGLSSFILSVFWALFFLWGAWMITHCMAGFSRGHLQFSDVGRYLLRLSFLIVFMTIIMR